MKHVSEILPILDFIQATGGPVPERKPLTKRASKQVDAALRVRAKRETKEQNLGYLAKPFILCGLPFQKPKKGVHIYKRVNGEDVLTIHCDPEHGMPFGDDMQALIWVSTLAVLDKDKHTGKVPRVVEFKSGREFLRAFDLPEDGPSYKRAQERFLRVFYSTYFFGKKNSSRAKLIRMHFFDELDLWFTKDIDTQTLPGEDFKNNRIKISEAFAEDLEAHHPPIDMEMVRMWTGKPGQLFFGLWLTYRCYAARGRVEIPLMGPNSVKEQCGAEGYNDPEDGPRNFRKKVQKWLDGVKAVWPDCPAELETSPHGDRLVIKQARAIHARKTVDKA